jgi:hypothetical protein
MRGISLNRLWLVHRKSSLDDTFKLWIRVSKFVNPYAQDFDVYWPLSANQAEATWLAIRLSLLPSCASHSERSKAVYSTDWFPSLIATYAFKSVRGLVMFLGLVHIFVSGILKVLWTKYCFPLILDSDVVDSFFFLSQWITNIDKLQYALICVFTSSVTFGPTVEPKAWITRGFFTR